MTKKDLLFITQRMHPELVYNMTQLEGNPYTFADVKTLLDGVTVGGHKLTDQQQVLRISGAWQALRQQIATDTFSVTKENFIYFNTIIATGEALEVGAFRRGQVSIAGTSYMPPQADELDKCFYQMMDRFYDDKRTIAERAFRLFLDAARYQFFYDGNKRTAQIMMNGVLMTNGHAPVSIPASQKAEYDRNMVAFYETNQVQAMLAFLQRLADSGRYHL
ncbi:Fic family protein [Pasteurellaceae bacterium TAE3-ERU1]|nr:Fic family protein [Pasteurellaceae bacterium TAE3-ERU1]